MPDDMLEDALEALEAVAQQLKRSARIPPTEIEIDMLERAAAVLERNGRDSAHLRLRRRAGPPR